MTKPAGRNDPCPCGSGKKYKLCCGRVDLSATRAKGTPGTQRASAPQPTPAALYQQALVHFQQGRAAECHASLMALLNQVPEQPDALVLLGQLAQRTAQPAAALELFSRAARSAPTVPQHRITLGNALQDAGRPAQAADSFAEAIRLKPDYAEAHNSLGNVMREQGRIDDAIASYRRAIALKPDYAYAHNNLANVLLEQGRVDEAIEGYRRALAVRPDYVAAYNNLGNALRRAGRSDEAMEPYCRALAAAPHFVDARINLGNALLDLGRTEEAIETYREAIRAQPNHPVAHLNLGSALRATSKPEAAEAALRQSLALRADQPEAHFQLANALADQSRPEAAVPEYREALRLRPNYSDAALNLGNAYQRLGREEDAEAAFRDALALNPDSPEACNNLRLLLTNRGELARLAEIFRGTLAVRDESAATHDALGVVLHHQGNLDEAAAHLRRAVALRPGFAAAHGHLGGLLTDQGRYDDAVACFRRMLELDPGSAEACNHLAGLHSIQGRFEDAEASYRHALALKPDSYEAYGNLLFTHAYHFLSGPTSYLALARGWEAACVPEAVRRQSRARRFRRAPLAGRRLRIGYVSGDYRQHAASHFLSRLLSGHSRERVELFAYSTSPLRDAVTERLQPLAEHWVPVAGLGEEALRERIDADAIDVLVDLSGHTAGHRLDAFARRAAPVQAHYMGYFASTGLSEMDWWIGDPVLTPPETDAHFSERVWRLPRTWVCYEGRADAPAPDWRPAHDGTVWLGSFNNLGKLTAASGALWARLLHALPAARLLLKTKELADPANRRRVLDAFAAHGIAAGRIELRDHRDTPSWPEHMAYYNRLDLALDPVGAVGGGTTTCDALWMGVPVIALAGDRMASRMTASMLHGIGRPEWIAGSEAEYIDKAVALARDVDRRRAQRAGQRAQMAASPLCDAADLTRELERAYAAMFEGWQVRQGTQDGAVPAAPDGRESS